MKAPPVRATLADRVVNWLNPVRGLQRAAARQTQAVLGLGTYVGAPGQFEGARLDRNATRNWLPRAQSADADSVGDLTVLRARARDLVRNAPIARGAIRTNVTHTLGTGLQLRATIDGEFLGLSPEREEALERDCQRIWNAWAGSTDCDITGYDNFAGLCDLALQGVLESGDILAIRRDHARPGAVLSLALQMVEADRVSTPFGRVETPEFVAGVEKDRDGRPQAFHVANRHPIWNTLLDGIGPPEWTRVPAYGASGHRLALLVMDRERPGQTRGIPYLAPVIEALKQLSRYSEAELTAAVVSSFFTVFTKTTTGEGLDPTLPDGGTPQQQATAGAAPGGLQLGPGTILDLAPGEDVTIANPARPNAQFDPFTLAVIRQIGMALELPYEVLIKHFSSSYTASKAALEVAAQLFRKRRHWITESFVRPVYEWVITEAVLRGMLDMPGFLTDPLRRRAFLGSEWIGPGAITLNPLQEANAAKVLAELKVKTRDEISIGLTGVGLERKVAQIRREAEWLGPVGAAPPAAARKADDDAAEGAEPPEPGEDKPDEPEEGTDAGTG